MTGISVQGIVKSFGGPLKAVDSVSFDVKSGELLTLLGPSGCGKTTTLRLIAGLETLDEGVISLGDSVISAPKENVFVPPEKRGMGMVFQSYAVWPHMTVAENVGFPLEMRRVPKPERMERVEAVLKTVGLEGFADRPATRLSGGQQQRIALARALVFNPEVLLLDEPFSNLDAKLREEMRFEVKDLQQRLNLTAIFVTHDQREAMVLSDRVIVMNSGRVEQEGTPSELYHAPASAFVLDFLGQVNYLDARVVTAPSGETVASVVGATETSVPLTGNGWSDGEAVTVGFRKEDVELTPCDAAPGPWRGVVHSAVFVGRDIEYVVDIGGSRIHALGASHEPHQAGLPVTVKIREGAAYVTHGGVSTSVPTAGEELDP